VKNALASALLSGGLVAAGFSQPAHSYYYYSYAVTINNGSVCHSINGTEVEYLQRRATSLFNLQSDFDVWTVCAVDLTALAAEYDSNEDGIVDLSYFPTDFGYGVQVDLATQNSSTVTGSCVLREVAPSGSVRKTLVQPFSIAPGGFTSVVFGDDTAPLELETVDDPNAVTVACLLPRNSSINRVLQIAYDIEWNKIYPYGVNWLSPVAP